MVKCVSYVTEIAILPKFHVNKQTFGNKLAFRDFKHKLVE